MIQLEKILGVEMRDKFVIKLLTSNQVLKLQQMKKINLLLCSRERKDQSVLPLHSS
jgi:hypothetical protein